MFNKTSSTFFRKISLFTGVLSLVAVAALALWTPKVYAAAECGPNAIIYCGFTSNDQFVNYLKNNKDNYPNAPHTDLQGIMNYFDLSSNEYERFRSTAKSGTVYKDGRVVVDGQTVINNANSVGRTTLNGRHNKSLVINGKTYYYGLTSRVFLSASMPAKVMFDRDGNAEFAVLTDCANPVWGDKVMSGAKCNMLNQTPVAGKSNTYRYTTTATASGNAKITKYVYDFGDGSAPVTKLAGSDVVEHTFKPGTWNVKVTIYADVPGGQTVTSTSTDCSKTVTVAQPLVPYYECIALKGVEPIGMKYTFTAQAKYGNGARFIGGDFDFGDGNKATGVKPNADNTITAIHSYNEAKKYSVTALLHFSLPDGKIVAAPTCSWVIEPSAPPVPECKPGIPEGDSRCKPCPYDASLTADDSRCKPPVESAITTLPNTGAGNIIAMSLAAIIGGFLFYRHKMFKKAKKAVYAAEVGTSPLPLADPLAPENPLADTPLEQQVHKSTLRRRRQF